MDYYQSQQLQFRVVQQQEEGSSFDKEPMFEKPLTPSDVGKLNRLVIPKQYAEKHFPLDGESGEKDLLLSFEDESGKAWRFRYSYWTSSQSYVLTKGWSRFVKEKQLDAGDVVLFLRDRRNGDRLYIGCRRNHASQNFSAVTLPQAVEQPNAALPWNPAAFCNTSCPAPSPSCIYLNSVPQGEESAAGTATVAPGNSKQLRLFGVNLECGHLLPGSHEFVTTNSSGE